MKNYKSFHPLPTIFFIIVASLLLKYLLSISKPLSTDFSMFSSSPKNKNKIAIVIGSGLAGLAASSQLLSQDGDIEVHLLEQAARTGGNSIKASSGINGANTLFQLTSNPPLEDSVEKFYDDSVKSAGEVMQSNSGDGEERNARERLIRLLSEESKGAVEWLGAKGVDFSVVAQLGGHTVARTHRGGGKSKPPGAAIVGTLLEELKGNDRFHLKTSCKVVKVLQDVKNEVVMGVEYMYEDQNVPPKTENLIGPLIFATGGFAGDAYGMLAQYRPDLSGFPSTNDPRSGSQRLLTDIGAGLIDMEKVQVHPTAFVDTKDINSPTKFLAAEMLRGEGGILLMDGRRFVDELETRKVVTEKIMEFEEMEREEGKPRQWDLKLVIEEGVYEKTKSHADFYLWKGLMKKCTIAEANLGEEAVGTLQRYADVAAKKVTDKFGRKTFGYWKLDEVKSDSVIYVGRVTPAIHFTMGGVRIDEESRVLNTEKKVIPGVWAAGEVTGGIHGDNRLGGSSLLECVVFGRRAADGVLKSLVC
ncbi:309b21de-3a6d-4e59-9d9e-821de13b576a [Sclerotinia trifoliorum]|uniref:Fumarate reductase n=1 Tax=Sclerotinia trifoliorum TaxID=28548 RepID=A0A8H2ZS73_9HELO|nr:309b21de-3a6d-4e59-9d9e-821de13b576a [Sclerotinia trifoliorum]